LNARDFRHTILSSVSVNACKCLWQ